MSGRCRVEALLRFQERAFGGSPWHSLMGSLEGLEEAAFETAPTGHRGFPWMDGSIRDIVYHVAGDKRVQLSQAFGDGSVTWESPGIRKGTLAQMSSDLESAHEAVADALRTQSDDSLASKVRTWGGKSMRAEEFFLMLIEHDLYHAGQIRYVRNLVE